MPVTLTRQLARFAVALRDRAVPDDVRRAAERAVLDWLGSAIRGGETFPARAISSVARCTMPGDEATVLASGERLSMLGAALANGAASHVLELDDLHQPSTFHPAAPVIPAALAAAERCDASGRAFLRAVVAGYEVGIRVAEAVNPSHYRFWHPTATCGVFGAAVAAGLVMGLTEQQLVDALGNAGTMAAGLWQFLDDGAMSKPLHAGKAAHDGVLAAHLAEAGLVGAAAILEGPRGFFRATAETVDVSRVTDRLGERFAIVENGFKRHACCGHTHTAIDAALSLRERLSIPAIEEVIVETYRVALDITDNPVPDTGRAAKFSLQHAVAVALLDGVAGLEQFTERRLADPAVVALRGRVTVREAPEFTRAYPGRWPARVRVRLTDGTTHEATVAVPRGMPGNDMTDDELREKFLQLVGPVLGPKRAHAVAAAVSRLEDGLTVRDLVQWCRPRDSLPTADNAGGSTGLSREGSP